MKKSIQMLAVAGALAVGLCSTSIALNAQTVDHGAFTYVAKKSGWHKSSRHQKKGKSNSQHKKKGNSGSSSKS